MDYCRIATPHAALTLRRHHKQNPANCLNICVDNENDRAQNNVRFNHEGATTTSPDATYPPAICQNSGGGGVQPGVGGGGSSRGSGGGASRGSGGGSGRGSGGRRMG